MLPPRELREFHLKIRERLHEVHSPPLKVWNESHDTHFLRFVSTWINPFDWDDRAPTFHLFIEHVEESFLKGYFFNA